MIIKLHPKFIHKLEKIKDSSISLPIIPYGDLIDEGFRTFHVFKKIYEMTIMKPNINNITSLQTTSISLAELKCNTAKLCQNIDELQEIILLLEKMEYIKLQLESDYEKNFNYLLKNIN